MIKTETSYQSEIECQTIKSRDIERLMLASFDHQDLETVKLAISSIKIENMSDVCKKNFLEFAMGTDDRDLFRIIIKNSFHFFGEENDHPQNIFTRIKKIFSKKQENLLEIDFDRLKNYLLKFIFNGVGNEDMILFFESDFFNIIIDENLFSITEKQRILQIVILSNSLEMMQTLVFHSSSFFSEINKNDLIAFAQLYFQRKDIKIKDLPKMLELTENNLRSIDEVFSHKTSFFKDVFLRDRFLEMNNAFYGPQTEKIKTFLSNFNKKNHVLLMIDNNIDEDKLIEITAALEFYLEDCKIKNLPVAPKIYLTSFFAADNVFAKHVAGTYIERDEFGFPVDKESIFLRYPQNFSSLYSVAHHENTHYLDQKEKRSNYLSKNEMDKKSIVKLLGAYALRNSKEFLACLFETIAIGKLYIVINEKGKRVVRKYLQENEENQITSEDMKVIAKFYNRLKKAPNLSPTAAMVTKMKYVEAGI